MIRCIESDKEKILEYIGKDYGKCAYLYIDFCKYGLSNDNVKVWMQRRENNELCAIVLQYYSGMHVYSRKGDFDPKEISELIKEQQPSLVCGMEETLSKLYGYVEGYEVELGKVLRLGKYTGEKNEDVYQGKREELKEVADLLMTDEEMGGPYKGDELYQQLLERFDTGFGRSWIRRDEKGIVSHCATYAELDELAVISGGIVRMDYRGTGQYPGQLGAMCCDLYNEGKEVISYYYGGAKSAHKKVGFEILGNWAKLIKQ